MQTIRFGRVRTGKVAERIYASFSAYTAREAALSAERKSVCKIRDAA
ncbi:MAG: hypothetical protein LBT20_02460 [Clostridiales bacterium]|nr:hypothetical protein [Clostridiales bacterium]